MNTRIKKYAIVFTGSGLALTLLVLLLLNHIVKQGYGIQGFYYANDNWTGEPALITQDATPFLLGEQGYKLLSTAVFTVVWKGWIFIEHAGVYAFATNSDDGSTLSIDGKIVVDNSGMHGLLKRRGEITLTHGPHEIEIRYAQYGGFSVMHAFWTPPNQSEMQIPSNVLFPRPPHRWELYLRMMLQWGIPAVFALNLLYMSALSVWGCIRFVRYYRARIIRLILGIRDALQFIVVLARRGYQPVQRWLDSSKWEQTHFVLLMLFATYGLFSCVRLIEFTLVKEPFVWGDEYVYRILSYRYWTTGDFYASSDAIHKGVKNMPNLLYPFLISWVSAFQTSFLFLIKLFNVLVMNAAIFPFFGLLRQFTSRKEAFWISALLLLMPWMNAANIVLVEPLFFLLFWLAFYFCHAFFVAPTVKKAMIAGGTIALAYVAKPTGIGILLACFGVMILLIVRRNMTIRERGRIVSLSGLMAAFSGLGILLLNLFLKGKIDFGLGYYQNYATDMAKDSFLESLFSSSDVLLMVVTHLSLILFLYLLPIVIACSELSTSRKQVNQSKFIFLAFGLLTSVIFLGITIKFTFSLGLDFAADLKRFHTRYHFITFPFYVMAFFLFAKNMCWSRPTRMILGLLCFGTLCYNHLIFLPRFAYPHGYPMIVDNMEYSWVHLTQKTPLLLHVIAALNLCVCLYYLFSAQKKRYPYLIYFLVFCMIANYYQIRFMMQAGHTSKKFTAYKIFLETHIPDFNTKVVFIENFWKQNNPYKTYTDLSHILFWLPYDVLLHKDMGKGNKIKEKHFPADAEYIVLSEQYVLDLPYQEKWTQDQYTILKR